jgi:hypothetical protein
LWTRSTLLRQAGTLLTLLNTVRPCCGSGSTWIRSHLAVLDPDPYWECRSGFRSMEIDQNSQINLVSCLSKMPLHVRCFYFFDLLPTSSIFFMLKFKFL